MDRTSLPQGAYTRGKKTDNKQSKNIVYDVVLSILEKNKQGRQTGEKGGKDSFYMGAP